VVDGPRVVDEVVDGPLDGVVVAGKGQAGIDDQLKIR
jgi:hypothetical protein